ncbi:MAG: penicillin acylase family protein [Acidobacteriota bacterium]
MKRTVFWLAIVAFTVSLASPLTATVTVRERIAGLGAQGLVERDTWGVPHITAQSETDLYFLQGYVHAGDRLFQMDTTRRQASGTLAELLGEAVLASDVELRTLGLRRAAERSLGAISSEARGHLEAYAKGVNAWVAANPLPVEYGALEITSFEPWTPVDSLVIAKAIAFSLSFDLDIDASLTLGAYQEALGDAGTALYFEDMFRSAPFDPAATVPDAVGPGGLQGGVASAPLREQPQPTWDRSAARLNPQVLRLAESYYEKVRQVPMLRDAIRQTERIKGSNEWAVRGHRTKSGRPLIANDPHLALDAPATFYPVHLQSSDGRLDVQGSGFAGVPYVIQGQNQWISWGSTTNPMDVTDTYLETVLPDPASPSGMSTFYQGNLEPIIPIPQVFHFNQLDGTLDNPAIAAPGTVVGGTAIPPAVLIVPRRNQGPIVQLDSDAGIALSVQYTGFSATREIDAFRRWERARNIDDFQTALQFFDVGSQNWVYGDVKGNIAYFTSAEMPIREDLQAGVVEGLPPYFIRVGAGGNEWLPVAQLQDGQAIPYEILPPAEMPHLINPPMGYFVNANNDPAGTTLDNDPLNQLRPGGGIYYLNAGYAQGTRAGRITQVLKEKFAAGQVDFEDMQEIQGDTVLLDAQVFVPHILSAFENASDTDEPLLAVLSLDAGISEAVDRLRHWDYSTPTGLAEGFDFGDPDRRGAVTGTNPRGPEIEASVAATIYSVWRGQMIQNTIDATLGQFGLPVPGSSRAVIALRHLLDTFDQNQGQGVSGVDFFQLDDPLEPPTADARRDIYILASLGMALERLAGEPFEAAFHGSTDQNDYRWGYLHRLVLDHPLGGPFSEPVQGPLPGLPGFPVDGGFGVVDASSHSARADSANDFMFGSGPVRRYVGELGGQPGMIHGESSLPGGSSAVLGNRWYNSILEMWLRNATYPIVQEHFALQEQVRVRRVFTPAP